jgi:hypothetical protein
LWQTELAKPLPTGIQAAEQAGNARDDDGRRESEREKYYADSKRVMLVHKLWPSTEKGQVYDVLIYVVPLERRHPCKRLSS